MNLKFIIIPARNCWYYFNNMNNATSTIEYQIFIGCHDVNTEKELVTEEELRNKVSSIFEKKLIDFSMISLKGGFLYANGKFVVENTLCINVITDNEEKINVLANKLSLFMNQESVLIVKNSLSTEYR